MAINIGRATKDPDDTIDVPIDWEPYLLSATISSGSCPSVPSGITSVSATVSGTTTLIHRLSGGTAGQEYILTSRVVPSTGGQLDLEFTVVVL